jgi:Fe-S cluster biosynthesis and repair protein YggX
VRCALSQGSASGYDSTMPTVHCVRCGQERDRIAFQPFGNELGRRTFAEICGVCWTEWLGTQKQLINHYALNLREPQAKEFLFKQMEQFLFGVNSDKQ